MVFASPKQILLDHLELKRDMAAADFGCGSGEWAVALARILEHGKVWGIDLLEEPLSAARSRARVAGLENLEFIRADAEKEIPQLKPESLDLVLMTNLLFQIDDKAAIFAEAKKVLKSKGKVLVIDWQEKTKLGPEKKVSPEEVKETAQKTGFELINEFKTGNFHYGLIFAKP